MLCVYVCVTEKYEIKFSPGFPEYENTILRKWCVCVCANYLKNFKIIQQPNSEI